MPIALEIAGVDVLSESDYGPTICGVTSVARSTAPSGKMATKIRIKAFAMEVDDGGCSVDVKFQNGTKAELSMSLTGS